MPASRTLLLNLAIVASGLAPLETGVAQGPRREWRWLYAVELGALHSTKSYESAPASYGLSMGVERSLTAHLAARGVVSWAESFSQGDDIGICPPSIDGSCLPRAFFPLRTWTLELQGVITPDRELPLKLLAGGGLAYPVGMRRNLRVTEHLEHDRTLKGIARAGASLGLGRSVRAPRVQYTRGWLSGPFESFDRIDQVGFILVF